MTRSIRNRSHLMLGCGSAALALALVMAPHSARAQGIQASGNVTLGTAGIDDGTPGETTVSVFSRTAAIDWTPIEDNNGDALDFLPNGATAIFQSGDGITDFAVLNRILPSTNGNIAVIDGTVISRIIDANGLSTPGGFVAFYSPTGILIGDNAAFDVGQLMLTTLNTSDSSFQNFVEFSGNMALQGAQGSTARIQINPGAQITATAENSFFAVVAADVQMLGTARINGSHAYVAGEVVNLSFSNGLFNISVPVGTGDSGTVMELGGTIGGPSSNGVGDNHMIYAVAAAQNDPISMIFRGNLGFDPAQSAGIVNGEIILSANYDVFGRFVDGGSISDGINATFGGNSATSNVRADIFMEDFNASSSLLAIGTHRTQVTAFNASSSVDGNLLMVGRENAELTASNGQTFTISGDVLVSAQDYGVVSSSLQSLDQINATGGVAFIDAFGGGTMNIGGNVLVAADAFAGADDLNGVAGTAQGGSALIGSTGGTLNISGSAGISARGVGTTLFGVQTGATSRGGLAQFFARQGGQVTLGGDLSLDAGAIGAQGSIFNPSSVSDAFGGQALISVFDGGGTLTVFGEALASASATGGGSNNSGAGSIGDAGEAVARVDGPGVIAVANRMRLEAQGIGGTNGGGTGGTGLGGRASAITTGGGVIQIGGSIDTGFDAIARGSGGDGQTGGDGLGGIAGANALTGSITVLGRGFADAEGRGGNASFGFGGTGGTGRGGNAFFQANGTLTETATITIAADALVTAQGFGGDGGQTDGQSILAGRGGDGYGGQFTVPNQADTSFNSGAFILAGGDNGTISVGGIASASSSAYGGSGGSGSSAAPGGRGGDAFGGLSQVGLALLGGDGSLGQGSANFGQLFAEALAFGGIGGLSFGDNPTGDGGDATGGNAFLTVRAGTITATEALLDASASGGQGANGGTGTGGAAAAFGSLGGSLTTGMFTARATGSGGYGGFDAFSAGIGGDGLGGQAELDFQGITVQINGDAMIAAEGNGGGTGDFTAGNGFGGTARLGVLGAIAGSGTITGNASVSSNGYGGSANNGAGTISGNGTGGTTSVRAEGGGTVSLATLQAMANGFGGGGEIFGYVGGDGTGGNADITATGSGSQITIARNVTTLLADDQNFGAILSANGVGGLGSGGTGTGGTGRGGTALVAASLGGTVALPATPFADPDTVGFIRLFARGFGGNSVVDGGTGGTGFGGNAKIEVFGGTLTMGETVLSSFTQGGTAQNGALDVTGGNAFGGSRSVIVRDGGNATLHFVGGAAGAQGGNGSGNGNGGNAYIGQNTFEIDNASANIIGALSVFDQSAGGDGRQGGNVFNVNPLTGLAGSLDITLDFANVTFTPDAGGVSGLDVSFTTRGGDGVVRGGNAQGPNVNLLVNRTDLAGGRLEINPMIRGGNASGLNGIGGDALGSLITIAISNSQLTLPGETIFAADAFGGDGGANGSGGNATSGNVDASFTNATINLVTGQQGVPGALRIRSQANGGAAGQMGNATSGRAFLNLLGSTVTGSEVTLEARALAAPLASGQLGGTATGGLGRINFSGVSAITADFVQVAAIAQSGQGGGATAGSAVLEVDATGTATITAPIVNVLADAFTSADSQGGIAGTTQGGQARAGSNGGSLAISGNLSISARGGGVGSGDVLSGATARGGQAQFFAQQGGSASVGGALLVDASAIGSSGSLQTLSSVSDAFGGTASISIFNGGGTLSVGSDALVVANAFGGTSNNSGAGSIGDAGSAVADIEGPGQITITGQLRLDAIGVGGQNNGGTGGIGLGGRASGATFGGGTIAIGSVFSANAQGEGGIGLDGGDGFGGIAGLNALIGTITVGDSATARSDGSGGDAGFEAGGTGGVGRGGNAFFQANGTLTQTASISITGNALASAEGRGGDGGDADGDPILPGRGGDGYGGQFGVPNQADPAFGSGAYILAGGDNGSISVGGDASAFASGFGGAGGTGLVANIPGGDGGDGFGGLAQVGLALLGQNGSLGQGSASFRRVLAEANGTGGDGGITDDGTNSNFNGPINGSSNSGILRSGNGGNGTGGDAFLTVRAGDVTADVVVLMGSGYGGEGDLAGTGTGGQAALFGGLGGTFTANQVDIMARGFGGSAFVGDGGDAFGGLAAIEGDGITVTINGNALVDAGAEGGSADNGAGGDGFGGEAYIATIDPATPGTITITGHAQVFANGVGGGTLMNFAAGNGTGGTAFVEALDGSTITLGSAQVAAIGRGGAAAMHQGGNGTGGSAGLRAIGANSRLIIQRNVPGAFANTLAGGAILSVNGIGENTNGGNGIGGTGRGGELEIFAGQGGSIALPTNLANDPNSFSPVLLVTSRGVGGGSSVEGGTGGQAFGGQGLIQSDGTGSNITMGETVFSVFAQGGSSLDTSRNITGGTAVGGSRQVQVFDGGSATLALTGGTSGGVGGNGSGTGDGGDAFGGRNEVELLNGTLNIVGLLNLADQSTGGSGNNGGDVFGNGENGVISFSATTSTITFTPDASGQSGIAIGGTSQGGQGIVRGGNAQGPIVFFDLIETDMNGASLVINPLVQGGNASAPNGIGGNAVGASVGVDVVDSRLDLLGEVLIAGDARGGAGGSNGTGGSATSGSVDVLLSAAANLSITANSSGTPGSLRVRSQADGGEGASMGNATSGRAALDLNGATVNAAQIAVESRSFANANSAGQTGAIAVSGEALFTIAGSSDVTADLIEIVSNAQTSSGGTTLAGLSALTVAAGSAANVDAGLINLLADAFGGDPGSGANTAGQFTVNVGGGNVNAVSLFASAIGDRTNSDLGTSRLLADGGNLNVADTLSARAFGNLLLQTGNGASIGGTTAAIAAEAGGTIRIVGDGSTAGGIGGQSIDLLAGRTIDVGGNLTANNGAITLTANHGGGEAISPAPVSVITMAQGTRIDAGTGTVTIHLLDGAGDPQRVNGAITLANISAGRIDVRNFGTSPGSDINVLADGVLTASGTGRAIDLASLDGEVINLAGDDGLILTGGGHYGIFAATPTGSQIGSLANYARRYNVLTAVAYDELSPGGNFAAFRISPVLTVTVNNAARVYGNANPQFTVSFAGFLAGDGIDGLLGTPDFATAATLASGIGTYGINATLGTLLSQQGYQFSFNPGVLTITPRPITVTANNLSRVYGNANPALTFTIGGLGLVNGDQLTGALATTAGATTGVGSVAITQGSLVADPNYALTFVNGQLTITPRPITLVADSLSKLLGLPDPQLTFSISGDGLINGDQLSGALVRDPGEGIGAFAIRQGTLSAGDNYAVTFVEGTLTINPPPAPDVLTNPTVFEEPLVIGEDPPVPGEEEEERFGMDFPDQPDAPLISEDPLLDDPVTSGGDASLYSGGNTPGGEDE